MPVKPLWGAPLVWKFDCCPFGAKAARPESSTGSAGFLETVNPPASFETVSSLYLVLLGGNSKPKLKSFGLRISHTEVF